MTRYIRCHNQSLDVQSWTRHPHKNNGGKWLYARLGLVIVLSAWVDAAAHPGGTTPGWAAMSWLYDNLFSSLRPDTPRQDKNF